jgi:hypothetical protein
MTSRPSASFSVIGLDAVAQVDNAAVHLAGERGLGQARADAGGHLAHREGAGVLAAGAVGERDLDHGVSLGPRKKRGVAALRSMERGSFGHARIGRL